MEMGELYNKTYKELMYALQPELKQKFLNLAGFNHQ